MNDVVTFISSFLAAICSIVLTVSESERIFSESKEVPSEMPSQPEELPPLASHEEAISIAHEFLSEVLGDEFFNSHFTLVKVDERPVLPTTWFVIYQYTSGEHTLDLSVALYCGHIPRDSSRIDVELSQVILQPQGILISEEQAQIIAQSSGLEPPYKITLSCDLSFHRICWVVMKDDSETLDVGDLMGLLIDAENGAVLETWTKGRMG